VALYITHLIVGYKRKRRTEREKVQKKEFFSAEKPKKAAKFCQFTYI
jgi:hypothetical protein